MSIFSKVLATLIFISTLPQAMLASENGQRSLMFRDCEKLSTNAASFRACIYEETQRHDILLNMAYQCLRKNQPKVVFNKLRDIQRAWIKQKGSECAYADQQGTIVHDLRAGCHLDFTATRSRQLIAMSNIYDCQLPALNAVSHDLNRWQAIQGVPSVSNADQRTLTLNCDAGYGILASKDMEALPPHSMKRPVSFEFTNSSGQRLGLIDSQAYLVGGEVRFGLSPNLISLLRKGAFVAAKSNEISRFANAEFSLSGSSRALEFCQTLGNFHLPEVAADPAQTPQTETPEIAQTPANEAEQWREVSGWAMGTNPAGQGFAIACSQNSASLHSGDAVNPFEKASFVSAVISSSDGSVVGKVYLQSGTNEHGHSMEMPSYTRGLLANGATVLFTGQDHQGFDIAGLTATFSLSGSGEALTGCELGVAINEDVFASDFGVVHAPVAAQAESPVRVDAQLNESIKNIVWHGHLAISPYRLGDWQRMLYRNDEGVFNSGSGMLQVYGGTMFLDITFIAKTGLLSGLILDLRDSNLKLLPEPQTGIVNLLSNGRVIYSETHAYGIGLSGYGIPYMYKADEIQFLSPQGQLLYGFPAKDGGRALDAIFNHTPFTNVDTFEDFSVLKGRIDILGAATGMSLTDAVSALPARFQIEPPKVQMRDLRHYGEFEGVQSEVSAAVSAELEGKSEGTRDRISMGLTSEVLDNRVWRIERNVSYQNNMAPSVETFKSALLQKYGPATETEISRNGNHLTYTWFMRRNGSLYSDFQQVINRCEIMYELVHANRYIAWENAIKNTSERDEFFREFGEENPECGGYFIAKVSLDGHRIESVYFNLVDLSLLKRTVVTLDDHLTTITEPQDAKIREAASSTVPEL